MVKVKPCAKVITIERAQNALTIERVIELFSTAYEHVCALKVVDKLVVNCLTHVKKNAPVAKIVEAKD